MTRPARWWRLAGLLYRQARQVRDLRRQLAEQQLEARLRLLAAEGRRRSEVEAARKAAADYRDEAISLDLRVTDAEGVARRERAAANAAWQEVGRLRLLADHPDMPAHLADQLRGSRREGVGADA